MAKVKTIAGLAATLLLVACAVTKVPVATGGSKADGTVSMSFQYGGFEKPEINWTTANQAATERCKVWGYTGSQAFGGATTTCAQGNAYGCNVYNATITYQCTGGPAG